MPDLIEHRFTCPSCWAPISILIDGSQGNQTFVEDCEVCCKPLVVSVEIEAGSIAGFHAGPEV